MKRYYYEARSHYRRFDDAVSTTRHTSVRAAQREAREMRDSRDPCHQDRSDMGASVAKVLLGEDGEPCEEETVWHVGYVK